MPQKLSITILVDDTQGEEGLLSEHGLALWIKADNRTILFDTGQSSILLQNAAILGVDISTANALVLSHGHYDHTGGVAQVLKSNPDMEIYCSSGVLETRYSRQKNGLMKPVGIDESARSILQRAVDKISWLNEPRRISKEVGITGPVPRGTDFEDTGGEFFFDLEGKRPDPIRDDLAMWFETQKGLVVITGCCHSGIVNTLKFIGSLTDGAHVYAIIGGFHLVNASPERIGATCKYLEKIGIQLILPCHCTGENAVKFLTGKFGERVIYCKVGVHFDFDSVD